jgi:hypothetical protein
MLNLLLNPPEKPAKVEISFQLVRKGDVLKLAWRALHEGDERAGEIIHALALTLKTMMAPYGGIHFCCCCGAEFQKGKKGEAFIYCASCEGQILRPVCATCAKLGDPEILQNFARSFRAEYPTAEWLTSKGWV